MNIEVSMILSGMNDVMYVLLKVCKKIEPFFSCTFPFSSEDQIYSFKIVKMRRNFVAYNAFLHDSDVAMRELMIKNRQRLK
jgi:hypothetical protein